MIKAITFDLDGVYFPDGKANFMRSLETHGVSEVEAKRVFMDSEEMRCYKLGDMSDDKFWAWAAEQWQVNLSPHELIALLIASYDIDQRVAETVRTVRRNGYKTLICSSNFPARINGLQARFHFLDAFDEVVLTYEVGAPKPSPEIFAELVRRAGVAASEIAFADDRDQIVFAAAQAGITAFAYKNFDGFIARLKELGVKL